MDGLRPSRALDTSGARGSSKPPQARAERRCALPVFSLCAASAAMLIFGLFVVSIWSRPPGYDAARFIFPVFLSLTSGTLFGVRALRRACRGAALYGGAGMAVAGIVLNSLPAFFVVIWVCIAVLPLHIESTWVSLQDGCSSLAQEVYHLAGRR